MARNYKKEYKAYHSKPIQKKRRAMRNTARRRAIKAGRVRKGSKKDVDHKIPLAKGGSNSASNLRIVSRSSNRKRNLGRGGRKKKRGSRG